MAQSPVAYYPSVDGTPEPSQGYTSAGYYFWDETWATCYGPYDSENIALEACAVYCRAELGRIGEPMGEEVPTEN